jgi:hypothetical protein
VDDDGDGVGAFCDECPDDAEKTEPGECGCGVPDVDEDNDGMIDCGAGGPDDNDNSDPDDNDNVDPDDNDNTGDPDDPTSNGNDNGDPDDGGSDNANDNDDSDPETGGSGAGACGIGMVPPILFASCLMLSARLFRPRREHAER